jgi:hypothetical protein
MNPPDSHNWTASWAWGVPLIVLTVVIHVWGLALINEQLPPVPTGEVAERRKFSRFGRLMSVITLAITVLHGIEVIIWAVAYRVLDALPDAKSAMLYSLGAMTTYGHANLYLEPHWQFLGALEALNGMLLFGVTTAFMFAMIQTVLPPQIYRRGAPRSRRDVGDDSASA